MIEFVTAVYGERYSAFLPPHLDAILRVHPDAIGTVVHRDVPAREVSIIARAFPRWRFVESETPMDGSLHQRIPRKLHAWRQGALLAEDRPLALLDCDAMPVGPLDAVWNGSWDVAYTWKNEPFPINTGVMLARRGDAIVPLLDEMIRRVEAMVVSPDRLRFACGCSGAADQHALREIVGFANYDRDTPVEVGGRTIVCRGLPCAIYNETNCVPLSREQRIIHFKTGWHPILLDGASFTDNRPLERCAPMFALWRQRVRDAGGRVAREIVMSASEGGRARYGAIADGYEERGVLHSEMLAVCSVARSLGVGAIVESGRARGQSTLQLARFFEGSPVRIVSVELARDDDAEFAEARLAPYPHCEIRYGDAFEAVPAALDELQETPAAVLLDGPKGLPAIDLIGSLFERFSNLRVAFLHDTRRQTPQRDAIESAGIRAFFTDDAEFVRRHADLDRACLPRGGRITMHTWRPGMKGHDPIPSYGPTMCVLLPTPNVALRVTQEIPA